MNVLIKPIDGYSEVWIEQSTSVISDGLTDPIMQINIQKVILDDQGVFVCNIGDPVSIQRLFSELLGLGLITPQFQDTRSAEINVIIQALAGKS